MTRDMPAKRKKRRQGNYVSLALGGDPGVIEAVDRIADRLGWSRSQAIRALLRYALEDVEQEPTALLDYREVSE